MKQSVSEIRLLSRGASRATAKGQQLYGIIERTARQRFGKAVRVQQEGQKGVVVWVEKSSFDDLLKWMDEIQYRYKIHIKEFSVEREETIGRVKSRIVMVI